MERLHLYIEKKLNALLQRKRIKNYLLNSIFSVSTSFGVEGASLGGAYQPICDSTDFSGDLLIEFPDGQISKAIINLNWLKDFEKNIQQLSELKYRDPSSKIFLEQPKVLKPSCQADSAILKRRYSKEKELLQRVKRLYRWMTDLGEKSRHINISIIEQRSMITNSKGLRLGQTKTVVSESAFLGDICGFDFSERSVRNLKKEDLYIVRTEDLYKVLSSKKNISQAKEIKEVVLTPEIFTDLFYHFVISNLSADSIYYKQSKFNLADFKNNKKIAPENLDLIVKPKLKMSVGAGDFSPEGWQYPDSFTYIENGRLYSPITPYRFANLLKLSPTPPINSLRLVMFGEIEKTQSLEEILKTIENGILITTLLGLHTQDSSTGNFSLVSPMGVWIEKGRLRSRLDCIIRGNMFKIIEKIDRVYRDPLTRLPYIKTKEIEVIT